MVKKVTEFEAIVVESIYNDWRRANGEKELLSLRAYCRKRERPSATRLREKLSEIGAKPGDRVRISLIKENEDGDE